MRSEKTSFPWQFVINLILALLGGGGITMACMNNADGQEVWSQCHNGTCKIQNIRPSSVADGLKHDREQMAMVNAGQSTGPASESAVKVTNRNSCGSGTIVGRINGQSLVLTNAHVAGTRIGRIVQVTSVMGGIVSRDPARVIMAAYSDRYLTDWAVLLVDKLLPNRETRLSRNTPTGTHYTTGSPRCVWPLRSTAVITADISDQSPLWRWRPNAIGGQSGSGVWSTADNKQYGLLTWSWGGLGAGQQTAMISRQAERRSVVGPKRIEGLKELATKRADIVECGFFAQADLNTLPIWEDTPDANPSPEPEPEPGPTPSLSKAQKAVLKTISENFTEKK